MNTTRTVEYLAGLFDGEGNAGVVRITRRKSSPKRLASGRQWVAAQDVPYLQLKMTDELPVRLLHSTFGGSCGAGKKLLPSGKVVWWWRVSHRQALAAAQILRPSVLVKGPQLDKIISHYLEYDPKHTNG